ncbi:hypothetical protein ACWCQZ_40730 [Streptomyces sp. NPDC002285]
MLELVWNGDFGRSYDPVRVSDDTVLTDDESLQQLPLGRQIAEALAEHGVDAELTDRMFCRRDVMLANAHRHTGGWVGDTCCWDEQLRSTE